MKKIGVLLIVLSVLMSCQAAEKSLDKAAHATETVVENTAETIKGISSVAGKTFVGPAADGRERTFKFNLDGMDFTVDEKHAHKFVKEMDGVLVYSGSFDGKEHFDAVKVVDHETVIIASPSGQGEVQNTIQDYLTAEAVVSNLDKIGVTYKIKK